MSDDSTRDIIISRLEQLAEQMAAFRAEVNERLSALEAKQYDTRPIWQAVEARLDRLEEKLETVNNKLDVLGRHSLATEADVVALGKRLEKLEGDRA
jgi:tetrahydromethanopterin S-methyltransferase subunit G